MIKLNAIADDDAPLDQSKLLYALEQTIRYAEENGGIGVTQTKLFNRKFAHWCRQRSKSVTFRRNTALLNRR